LHARDEPIDRIGGDRRSLGHEPQAAPALLDVLVDVELAAGQRGRTARRLNEAARERVDARRHRRAGDEAARRAHGAVGDVDGVHAVPEAHAAGEPAEEATDRTRHAAQAREEPALRIANDLDADGRSGDGRSAGAAAATASAAATRPAVAAARPGGPP